MGRRLGRLALIALVLAWTPSRAGTVHVDRAVAAGNQTLALALYEELAKEPGNLFFSPHSIATALAMTYAGADGETAAQMKEALSMGVGGDVFHHAMGALNQDLMSVAPNRLVVANSLWPQVGHPFQEPFVRMLRLAYGVDVTPLDYAGDTEAARVEINEWVAARTEDLIKDLIGPGVLSPLTRLVLVNAIYFKGLWALPFDPALTTDLPFRTGFDKSVPVPMMSMTKPFRYVGLAGVQLLELPYQGDRLSMLVILPENPNALAGVERMLSEQQLGTWIDMMNEQDVRVILPKLRLEWGARNLNSVLQSLGMVDAFDADKADFTRMDGGLGELFVSAVVHKAFVEINEEGTEAAAATAVIVAARSMPRPIPEFRADRPFLFLIRDRRSGAILFMGRLSDPSV